MIAVTAAAANTCNNDCAGGQALGWRIVMVTVVAHTRKLSRFFGRVAQRLYEARLATAEREVNCYRQFLGRSKL